MRVDAGMDRELGRADDLRLHGDVVADDVEHRRCAARASLEVLASSRSAASRSQVVSSIGSPYPVGVPKRGRYL